MITLYKKSVGISIVFSNDLLMNHSSQIFSNKSVDSVHKISLNGLNNVLNVNS